MADLALIFEQIETFRRQLLALEYSATKQLSVFYQQLLTELEQSLTAFESELVESLASGQPLTSVQVFQMLRYRALISQTEALVAQFSSQTAQTITTAQQAAIRAGLDQAGSLLANLTGGARDVDAIVARFVAISDGSVASMTGALQQASPFRQLLESFAPDAIQAVIEQILQGVALGKGPTVIAQSVQDVLGITRARAETIMRTEVMRANRETMRHAFQNSDDIVKGWKWVAAHSERTCSACLSKDGSIHPLSETMSSHPNCRCRMVPWLGPDLDLERETGEEWLKKQPPGVQDKVLGSAGGKAYRAGEVELQDFVKTAEDPTWGTSYTDGGVAWAKQQAAERGFQQPVSGGNIHAQSFDSIRDVVSAPSGHLNSIEYAQVDEAIANIDLVHSVENIPPISISVGSVNAEGAFDTHNLSIVVNPKALTVKGTTVHELGHAIDFLAFGSPGSSSTGDPMFQSWLNVVQNSATYQDWMDLSRVASQIQPALADYLTYFLRPHELWARSYSQYIALRSGDKQTLAVLVGHTTSTQSGVLRYQWTDTEFAPIANEIDALFAALGWKK